VKIKKQNKSMKVGFYFDILKYFFFVRCRAISALCLSPLVLLQPVAVYAKINQTEDKKINLKLNSVTIPYAISELQDKTGCVINYDKKIFNPTQKVSLDLKDAYLQDVLRKLLAGTRVGFRYADQNTIILYELPEPVKPGKISGRIVDEKGETLPGASVKVVETGAGIQAGTDGSYTLSVNPGTYTIEISYMSFQTQRITGVVVREGKSTPLEVSLKPDTKGLKEVVVTAGYKKASTAGLLAKQKNASEISNGISAEQIARTPDKNVGESLKRISGVSTVDNKFILVRGIGERYNSAMLDGVVLPSTEAQSRNFSFDLIPSNMVDNVVVSKTVTPDMNASFGGGLIQINTKDIPNENFTSFAVGVSYNDQTTGKDFLSHKRGKYDYLGFDDGRRAFPKDLVPTARDNEQNIELTDEQYWKKVTDQSLGFKNDNFTVYKYKAIPSQNYQFSIGRLISLDTANNNKLGFTGSLSYRNTQNINIINQQNRGSWDPNLPNTGNTYDFNTTWGGLLNAGLQLGKNNRFSLRNTYTHVYDNALTRIVGYDQNGIPANPPNRIEESDDPIYTDLLQNKLSGQHQFGKIKIDWDAARTSINRKEKDLSIVNSYSRLVSGQYEYFPSVGNSSNASFFPTSRQNYANREINYSWDVSATIPFNLAGIRSSVKAGYFGNRKKAKFDWLIAAFTDDPATPNDPRLQFASIAEMQKQENIGKNGLFYTINPLFSDTYEGESRNHAGFIMLDNRFGEKLRLVWGIRGEYYKYNEINNGTNTSFQVYSLKPDPRWQWLPSANLTYSPLTTLNIRAAYSSSIVRPELMDNSQFWRYRADLGGQYGNQGLYSTKIDSWDFKTEWFPGLGEIISAGAFYKKFDNPAELNINTTTGNLQYYLKSADWAKVYGFEFELRKSLGFIADYQILNNISVYGNLTLQKSEVKATFLGTNPDPTQPPLELSSKLNRYMYGQSPYLVNVGLQYTGTSLGVNVMFNKSGYKTYIVGEDPTQIEYERPRQQIDAQVSYRFFSKKLELKVNAGNLLNTASTFYRNTASYEPNPDYKAGTGDISDAVKLKPGFTNKYEDGDRLLFSQKFGRTYSTSLTYTF
jgi:outer membrane receptor protein involved in Fe transport